MVMGGVAVALLLALTFLAMRGPSDQMGYLFTDLDPQNAQAITQKLSAQNVPFQLSADGTAVMAPQGRLAELRMALAGDQLGGKIGYDVLDAEQPFGLSAAREKMNETRAIEGELARSIGTLDAVNSARVRIVMPERGLFENEGRKASAAITLKTRGRLSAENIAAIRNLVASSVPELSPEAVSIIDSQGRLLARAGDAGAVEGAGDIDERQTALEARLRQEVETLLAPLVGEGKVRAEVAIDLDREMKREEARVFDPDKQVISRQISVDGGEQSQENAGDAGTTSVSNQLPAAQASTPGGSGDQRQSTSKQTSEDTTYDNSHTDTVTQSAPGAIKRLSVAVMVDGGKGGLPAAQVAKLTRIVENAVGFDASRGDSVVVDSMPFVAPVPEETMAESLLSRLPTSQLFTIGELLLIAGVGIVVLRMLRGNGGGADGGALALAGVPGGALTAEGGATPALGADGRPLAVDQAPAPHILTGPSNMAQLDQEIALTQVEGNIKASSLKRLGETIAENPAESASVIRRWMNE